jgi:outer membrane protein OmpA-like peptidoglycan-associated protein
VAPGRGGTRNRAEAVAAALRSRGIDLGRLEILGLGEAYPIASNDTSAGREANRRMEVVLSDAQGQFPKNAYRAASIP